MSQLHTFHIYGYRWLTYSEFGAYRMFHILADQNFANSNLRNWVYEPYKKV